MVEGVPTEEGSEHRSDQEWADEIFRRAQERPAITAQDGAEPSRGSSLDEEALRPLDAQQKEERDIRQSLVESREAVAPRPMVTREDLGSPANSYLDSGEQAPGPPIGTLPDYGVRAHHSGMRLRRQALEWGAVVVGALVMALLVKAFLFQAYYIPSPSMEPTLGEGDRIIVNKLSYRLHDVNRGDMVVFAAPEGTGGIDDLVKRVIGLPGELVRIADGRVLIGGGMLLEPYLPLQDGTTDFGIPPNCANLPQDLDGCRVPPDHVFVLGDYRDNSRDSRFFGPIPTDSIRGRAFLRIWPMGEFRRL